MDGNFLVKRVDGSGEADKRVFRSDYLITPEEVDVYKDEVRHQPKADKNGLTTAPCANTNNWTAAAATGEETVKAFEQTGLFLCACRHGIVEIFAEMRHSGELSVLYLVTRTYLT
jgi:hypothetical protein